jgi:glycosyltransferase involved in cell wall biosynthesis
MMKQGSDQSPTVSILVSTYNWSSVLACALRSIQLQTFEDYEVLVVGDGCTDDSETVVASFNDRRFKWHNLERNYGSQWAPNNHGLREARGTWIAYLGHDDIWYPTHLASALSVAATTRADLVAGVMILYGPAGSGYRAISGVFDNGEYSPADFMPPSSILHQSSIISRIGYWKDPETIEIPVDCEFLQRAVAAGTKVSSTNELSVFKFNAAWRRDAYKRKDATEQQDILNRIESGKDFRQGELLGVLQAACAGTFFRVMMPIAGSAGEYHNRNRIFKGMNNASDMARAEHLDRATRFFLDNQFAPFEWHSTEVHDRFGSFRWSGPLSKSSVDLPVRLDQDFAFRVHIVGVIRNETLDALRLFANDQLLPFQFERTAEETIMLSGHLSSSFSSMKTEPIRLSFEVKQTARPIDLGLNQDSRSLGIAVNWIELAPESCRGRVKRG